MAIPDRKKLAELFADMQRIEEHRTLTSEKQIRKLYKEMLTDLQGFLGVEYAKYSEDDALTYTTLARKGEHARFLEEVQARVNNIMPKVNKTINDVVEKMYKTAYDGMVNAVSKAVNDKELTKLLKGIVLTPAQVIKAAVNNPVSKLTLSKTLEKNRKQIVYNIKQTVTVGIMNGDRMSTMARKIQNDVDQNYRKAMLISRTEVHRVRETGHNDACSSIDNTLSEAGSEYRMVKIWKSMRDEKVRKTSKADHRKMEGQVVLQDEDFDLGRGVTAPCPGQSGTAYNDCNCRCYVSHDLMNDEEFFQATGRHFKKIEKPKETAKPIETSQPEETKEIPFTPANTIKEATEYAKQLGIENVDYSGASVEMANEWNEGLHNAFQEFPELKENFRFVGTTQNRNKLYKQLRFDELYPQYKAQNPNADDNFLKNYVKKKISREIGKVSSGNYAQSVKHPLISGVTFNKAWDYSKMKKALSEDVKTKFHPVGCDTVRSVLDHEIGHQLDDLLGISKNSTIIDLFNSLSKQEITDKLSRYAWDNSNRLKIREFIAEGWAEFCNNPNPRPIAKQIGEVIKGVYAKWKK